MTSPPQIVPQVPPRPADLIRVAVPRLNKCDWKDDMEVCSFNKLTGHDGPTNLEIGREYEAAYNFNDEAESDIERARR